MKKNIGIQTFSKLSRIFESKSWNINETESSSFFNRVSRTLGDLDTEEQQTFLKLLDMTDYYSISDYETLLMNALKEMKEKIATNKFLFLPVISNRIDHAIKSSMLVTYLLKANTIQYDPILSKLKMTLQIDLNDNQIKNLNNKDKYLVLVDDFIGTGLSATKAASYFVEKGVLKEKIIILSLVTLTRGIEHISEQNYKFFYAIKSLSLEEKTLAFCEDERYMFNEHIKCISKKIGINIENYLGFEDSGGLVSMIRVPNNTVEILWRGENKKNIPFPRFG